MSPVTNPGDQPAISQWTKNVEIQRKMNVALRRSWPVRGPAFARVQASVFTLCPPASR